MYRYPGLTSLTLYDQAYQNLKGNHNDPCFVFITAISCSTAKPYRYCYRFLGLMVKKVPINSK